jgi:flagellar hook protein FlgE
MGLSGNDLVLQGTIGDKEFSKITFSEGNSVGDFLNVTFTENNGNSYTADMEMTGINSSSGLPELADYDMDLDGDGTADTVSFDSSTGQVLVTGGISGEVLWTGDIGASLNYETVELDGTNYLTEFNDLPSGDRELVLWGDDGSGTIGRYSETLQTADDGSFDIDPGLKVTVGGTDYDLSATSSGKGVSLSEGGTVLKTFDLATSSVHNTKYDIYDSQGNAYTLETSWEKVNNNTWRWRTWLPDMEGVGMENNTGLLEFTPDGLVKSVTDSSGAEASTININFASLGADDSSIQLDFTGDIMGVDQIDAVTQFGSAFTTKEYFQDGYRMGVLNDYSVGGDGIIRGVYDNGQTEDLFTVGLAVFSNSSGLEKLGSGAYRDTANSGIPQILRPMEGGAGKIAGSSLEASNVDLTQEFVDLIKAQRGFQASARVITTSDQILEELMNLKR